PLLTPSYILTFQFLSWCPSFANVSPRSTIIRPLDEPFKDYLESDGILVPDGSDDVSVNLLSKTTAKTTTPIL
ncbi:hypothetical protein F5I97DRAFT_1810973, partial [Phlebopus sp. FC_14]